MSTITESVTIEAPARATYEQWAAYESLPRFADGVINVEQRDDDVTHWTVSIAGVTREFDAQVLERIPGRRLAWRSLDGPQHAGAVEFEAIDDNTTRVTARMDLVPEGFAEMAADRLGVINVRVRRDLEQFKQYMEDGAGQTAAAARPEQWQEPPLQDTV
ncbi:SRPBCC family protein [Phytomonospora sp. NPDC050363]|uniref:SRPBCC family protein n=1 Tax=Phytomonospora sp. NPDC050363 TaxID=3155642 RepID=UPI0033E0F6F4